MGIVNCIFTVLGKPTDEKDEQVMLSFHNMTKFEKWCDQLFTSMGQRKNLSPQQKLNVPCGRKFLRVLIFVVFPAIRKNKFLQIKITANFFPTKIYSRVNFL